MASALPFFAFALPKREVEQVIDHRSCLILQICLIFNAAALPAVTPVFWTKTCGTGILSVEPYFSTCSADFY